MFVRIKLDPPSLFQTGKEAIRVYIPEQTCGWINQDSPERTFTASPGVSYGGGEFAWFSLGSRDKTTGTNYITPASGYSCGIRNWGPRVEFIIPIHRMATNTYRRGWKDRSGPQVEHKGTETDVSIVQELVKARECPSQREESSRRQKKDDWNREEETAFYVARFSKQSGLSQSQFCRRCCVVVVTQVCGPPRGQIVKSAVMEVAQCMSWHPNARSHAFFSHASRANAVYSAVNNVMNDKPSNIGTWKKWEDQPSVKSSKITCYVQQSRPHSHDCSI